MRIRIPCLTWVLLGVVVLLGLFVTGMLGPLILLGLHALSII